MRSLDGPECKHGHSYFNPNRCKQCDAETPGVFQAWRHSPGCGALAVGNENNCTCPGRLRTNVEGYVADVQKYGERLDARIKASNPKDAIGVKKARWFSFLPLQVLVQVGQALLEGALKYGKHNYRDAGVRASVYVDACVSGHLTPWYEGEDTDPDSGFNHIDKAIASLIVLRDGMLQGNWVDDRPIKAKGLDLAAANKAAVELIGRYPNPKQPFTQLNQEKK